MLTFVWGAFGFISVVARGRAWHLLPCIAMLAYGWVFHMGFFNFYLSMGLCFWAMRLAWEASLRRVSIAALLLALAYVAHALPVVWTLGLLAYAPIARRLSQLGRSYLTAAFVLAIGGVHAECRGLLLTRWSPSQFALSTGIDQAWVFDGKYYIVLAGLLGVWGLLFLGLSGRRGARDVVGSVPFHLCVIAAATVCVLPGGAAAGILALTRLHRRADVTGCRRLCLRVARHRPARPVERYALAIVVAVVFFCFVYRDERALNILEDRMQDVVSTLPSGVRVVNSIQIHGFGQSARPHDRSRLRRPLLQLCQLSSLHERLPHPRDRPQSDRGSHLRRILESADGEYLLTPEQDLPLYSRWRWIPTAAYASRH